MIKKVCDRCGDEIHPPTNPNDINFNFLLKDNTRDGTFKKREKDICHMCGEDFIDIVDSFFKKCTIIIKENK